MRRARVVFNWLVNRELNLLTTAHAQLTRGRQEALISGPENQ